MKFCTVEGCERQVKCSGLCNMHYQRHRLYGRITTVLHVNRGMECAEEGCSRKAYTKGFCKMHHRRRTKSNDVSVGTRENHPLYSSWLNYRRSGTLVPEWSEDFLRFIADVKGRPSRRHRLRPIRDDELVGPENFEWYEQLRQGAGEQAKDWYARKWEARKDRDPRWDHERNLLKKYGITRTQYDAMFAAQDGKCAICFQPETFKEVKSDKARLLAVDHCHKTGMVRNLLCWRCNTTLGAVKESNELLEAMKVYLRRHLACEAA